MGWITGSRGKINIPQVITSAFQSIDGSLFPGGIAPSSIVVPSNTGVGTQTANTILNAYHASGSDRRDLTIPLYQPQWYVAGVDYAVGPKTIPTKNPQTQTPAGCSVSGSTFTVSSDNTVVDGFDFTLGNSGAGYQIHAAANGVTFTNCKIPVMAITGTYALQVDGDSPTLTYNDFDGGVQVSSSIINMISWSSGTGTMTLEYNYFHSVPSSPINYGNTLASGNTPTTVCKYNFYTNMSTYSGAHMNLGQFGNGGFASVTFDFNTFYQTPNTAGGEGFQVYLQDNTGTGPLGEIQGGSSSYNTLICPVAGTGTVSNFYDIGPPGGNQQSTPIGGAGGAGALITGSITGTDLNITAIQGVARVGDLVFTRSGTVVSSATTIVSQTSGTTGSTGHYAVNNSQTVTSQSLLLGAFTIANNYIDFRGSSSGGFMHDQNGAEIIPDTTNHYMPTGQWVDIANTLH